MLRAGTEPDQTLVRTSLKAPRAGAVAGIVFSLLLIVSLALIRSAVPADPGDSGSWLPSHAKTVALALNILPFAGVAFLWFIGVLRDRIGDLEDKLFASVFLGSGLLFLAMLFAIAAIAGGALTTWGTMPAQARRVRRLPIRPDDRLPAHQRLRDEDGGRLHDHDLARSRSGPGSSRARRPFSATRSRSSSSSGAGGSPGFRWPSRSGLFSSAFRSSPRTSGPGGRTRHEHHPGRQAAKLPARMNRSRRFLLAPPSFSQPPAFLFAAAPAAAQMPFAPFGARQVALGGASVGLGDDPASFVDNPALLTPTAKAGAVAYGELATESGGFVGLLEGVTGYDPVALARPALPRRGLRPRESPRPCPLRARASSATAGRRSHRPSADGASSSVRPSGARRSHDPTSSTSRPESTRRRASPTTTPSSPSGPCRSRTTRCRGRFPSSTAISSSASPAATAAGRPGSRKRAPSRPTSGSSRPS